MALFKFELKRQLKNILFWICVICSCASIVPDALKLFKIPVQSDEAAYNFLIKEDHNLYHINIQDWYNNYKEKSEKKYGGNYFYLGNYQRFKTDVVGISNKINKRTQEVFKDTRFSNVFFTILTAICSQYTRFIMPLIFSFVWMKDRQKKTSALVKTSPIKRSRYLVNEFMSAFVPYIIIIFSISLCLGVFEKIKLQNTDFVFNLFDIFPKFFSYTFLPLLFAGLFEAFTALLLKNVILSVPLCILLAHTKIFEFYPVIFGDEAIVKNYQRVDWVYAPPYDVSNHWGNVLVWCVLITVLFIFSCYIFKCQQEDM